MANAEMDSDLKNASRAQEIMDVLAEAYPSPRIELDYSNPLELLVATMLSAQSTDKTVNRITKDLFRKYRRAEDYANADVATFEKR